MEKLDMIMSAILLIATAIYAWTFYKTAALFWKPKFGKRLAPLFVSILGAITIYALTYLKNEPIIYLAYLMFDTIILLIFFRISITAATFASLFASINTICIKGVLLGIVSLFMKSNLYQTINTPNVEIAILAIIVIIKTIIFRNFRNANNRERSKYFFDSPKQLNTTVVIHSVLFVFMLFYSYNYYYNLDLVWFSFAQTLLSALILMIFYIILISQIQVSTLIYNDIRNKHVSELTQVRLAQYKQHENTISSLTKFKHSYHEMILSTQYLLEKNEVSKAYEYLNTNATKFLDTLPVFKEYSNNRVCDSIIYEWTNLCELAEIGFTGDIYIPDDTHLDLQAIYDALQYLQEIFSPLAMNMKNPQEAKISLSSSYENNWLVITCKGTYNGVIEIRDDIPYFITEQGVDIKTSYRRLITLTEANKRLLTFTINPTQKIFTVEISMYN